MLWSYWTHFVDTNLTKLFRILIIWSGFRYWCPPGAMIQEVHLRLLLVTRQCILCCDKRVVHCLHQLYSVRWPNMCNLDLPIRNLNCYAFPFWMLSIVLQSHWHGDGGSVWLLATDHNLICMLHFLWKIHPLSFLLH